MRDKISNSLISSGESKLEDLGLSLLRADAWHYIFLGVMLALGATIIMGLMIWCLVYQNKKFSGGLSINWWSLSAWAECV